MPSDDSPGRLIVSPPDAEGFIAEIGERLSIGRSPHNHLVIEDPKVSRNHAEIRHLGGGHYRLADVGSSNGTWVNGRPLTTPKELEHGDQIMLGSVRLRFTCPGLPPSALQPAEEGSTVLLMRTEQVVILVADIRNYTSMSEALPGREFSHLVSQWFKECSEIIESASGTIDKFIGDAVMAYWVARTESDLALQAVRALETAQRLLGMAQTFSGRLAGLFPGYRFAVGIGLNAGEAVLGNVGTGEKQSFTVVGDCVNVAFRLEGLTKEKGRPVVVSSRVAELAAGRFQFEPLGLASVKGRKEPVAVCSPLAIETGPADTRTPSAPIRLEDRTQADLEDTEGLDETFRIE